MTFRPRAAILLLSLLAPLAAAEFQARVVAIQDGDTLTVLSDDRQIRIRLHGIDCPESGQAFGRRAKEFTGSLAFGKVVTILVRDTDRYGRTVADVILPDGRNLNHALMAAGLAWWYRQYAPDDRELRRLEAAAREAGVGLWADASPAPPWEWRKGGAGAKSRSGRRTGREGQARVRAAGRR